MTQIKSFKAGMLKSFKQDNERIEPYQRAHYWDIKQNKEAYKRLETAKFVSCETTPYDIETMNDTEVYYGNNEGIALFFETTHRNFVPKTGVDSSIPVAVHFVKDNDDITIMDVYEFGITGSINFLGTVTLEKGGEFVRKDNRNRNFEGDDGEHIKNNVDWIMSSAPIIAGRLAKYKVVEMADLSKTLAMKKISYQLRSTYNIFELVDTPSDQYLNDRMKSMQSDAGIFDYTGPYKGYFEQYVGINDLSDAKLIRYAYEGSRKPFDPELLKVVPFNNFILASTEVGNDIKIPHNFMHYNDGILSIIITRPKQKLWRAICKLDLRDWATHTPLSVNPKDIINYPGIAPITDINNCDDLLVIINKWINAFSEFMFKFDRLMPYSENVNNTSLEIHTATVVNNTSVYKIVVLDNDKKKRSTSGHKGGTHASPREHTRIAHKRTYKSGKVVYFPEVIVNEGCVGKVHKEYDATNLR